MLHSSWIIIFPVCAGYYEIQIWFRWAAVRVPVGRQFVFQWGGSSCSRGAAVRVPVGQQFVSSKAIVCVPVGRQFVFQWGGSSCSSVPVGRQFVSSKAIVRVPVDANLQSFLPFNHLQSTDKI